MSGAAAGVRALEERLHLAGQLVAAKYYAGARHEVLNETTRNEATSELLAWLDQLGEPTQHELLGSFL